MQVSDNRVQAVLDLYRKRLSERYPASELRALERSVFRHQLGWDMGELEMRRDQALSESELLQVYRPLDRLVAGEPLQYVLGSVVFHGLTIGVSPAALIPRPETEELVDRIVRSGRAPRKIIDIGTGSGCIALALKQAFPDAQVTGADISEAALELARTNGDRHGLEVTWIAMDALNEDFPEGAFDLVVSNPPYIPEREAAGLDPVVRDHEPPMALFVPDEDSLCFYRAIASRASDRMTPEGELWFEVHHEHSGQVADLLGRMGWKSVQVHDDLSGNPRSVRAEWMG